MRSKIGHYRFGASEAGPSSKNARRPPETLSWFERLPSDLLTSMEHMIPPGVSRTLQPHSCPQKIHPCISQYINSEFLQRDNDTFIDNMLEAVEKNTTQGLGKTLNLKYCLRLRRRNNIEGLFLHPNDKERILRVERFVEELVKRLEAAKTCKTTHLDLSDNDLPNVCVNHIFSSLPRQSALEELILTGNNVDLVAAKTLRRVLEEPISLTSLDIGFLHLDDQSRVEIAEGLATNKSLLKLKLDGCAFTSTSATSHNQFIDALLANQTLTSLTLSRGVTTMMRFAEVIKTHPSLTHLDLSENSEFLNWTTTEKIFKALCINSNITSFNFEGNKDIPGGLKYLGNLTYLNISDVKNQHGLLALFQGLKKNKTLLSLDCRHNTIYDVNILDAFHDMIRVNKTLTALDIRYQINVYTLHILPLAKALNSNNTLKKLCMGDGPVPVSPGEKEIRLNDDLINYMKNSTALNYVHIDALYMTDESLTDLSQVLQNRSLTTLIMDYCRQPTGGVSKTARHEFITKLCENTSLKTIHTKTTDLLTNLFTKEDVLHVIKNTRTLKEFHYGLVTMDTINEFATALKEHNSSLVLICSHSSYKGIRGVTVTVEIRQGSFFVVDWWEGYFKE